MTAEPAAKPKARPAGRTINFNLVGDDLFLYETVREIYEGEQEDEESAIASALEALDPETRALVQSRFAPQPARKELSHRQVFVRALRAALAVLEAKEDARVAAEATESESDIEDNGAGSEAPATEG